MRKQTLLFVTAAITLLGACSRTSDGDVVVNRPSDVQVQTTQDTIHLPTVTTRTDTINTPVVGVKKDTLIVDKPIVGMKKSVVKVPAVRP